MLNKVRGRASRQCGLQYPEAKEKKSEIFSSPGGCREQGTAHLGKGNLAS